MTKQEAIKKMAEHFIDITPDGNMTDLYYGACQTIVALFGGNYHDIMDELREEIKNQAIERGLI